MDERKAHDSGEGPQTDRPEPRRYYADKCRAYYENDQLVLFNTRTARLAVGGGLSSLPILLGASSACSPACRRGVALSPPIAVPARHTRPTRVSGCNPHRLCRGRGKHRPYGRNNVQKNEGRSVNRLNTTTQL